MAKKKAGYVSKERVTIRVSKRDVATFKPNEDQANFSDYEKAVWLGNKKIMGYDLDSSIVRVRTHVDSGSYRFTYVVTK